MRESNEEFYELHNSRNSNFDIGEYNSLFQDKNKDFISPFSSSKKEIINEKNNMSNQPDLSINDKDMPFFLNNMNTIDNIFNNINYNNHFFRKILTDEDKKNLQPRDSSFIDKIFDFIFNW